MSQNIIFQQEYLQKQKNGFLYSRNGWILFGVFVVIYSFLAFLSVQYIFTEELYYRSLSDQLTQQNIENLLGITSQYWWIDYLLTPVLLTFKVSYTTICISIGIILSNIEFKFKTIFKVALLAEVVFVIGQILHIVNLSFHSGTLTLETVSNYYPLSVLSYFGAENVVQWLQYPLQTLNLFEVVYMVVIGWLLSKQWKEDFMESLAVVVPSYATGLLLWLVFVTFIMLQVS